VVKIAIYVEGGGPTRRTQDLVRRGFSAFLRPAVQAARACGGYVRPIVCGGRGQAYDKFCDALLTEPDVLNILLVDSEDPIEDDVTPWDHLRKRKGDEWDKPEGANDMQCQMMVVCMEAWFLADPKGLKRHYRRNFDVAKLPSADLAESRTKADINDALKKATKNTEAGEYRKIRDGAKLLEKVDAAEVRRHCKWCDRLFKALGTAIGASI